MRARLLSGLLCGLLVTLAPTEVSVADRAPHGPAAVGCVSCHADVAREWESSLHRRSFSDPLFQAGYRVDHRAFCRDCHAPRSHGADPIAGSIAHDEGITCTECHQPLRAHPSAEPTSDHRERACADCHQFHFPADPSGRGFDPTAFMQRTESEWRESGRTESCAGCHMGSRGHTFALRPDDLRASIAIEGELVPHDGVTEVVVRLSNAGAGHAIPTGDVLRALELRVWPVRAPEEVSSATLTRVFGTSLRFDPRTGLSGRLVEREDTRVPPRGEHEERFVLEGRVRAVAYRLDYLRANRRNAEAQGLEDAANRIVLHEGVFTAGSRTRRASR